MVFWRMWNFSSCPVVVLVLVLDPVFCFLPLLASALLLIPKGFDPARVSNPSVLSCPVRPLGLEAGYL